MRTVEDVLSADCLLGVCLLIVGELVDSWNRCSLDGEQQRCRTLVCMVCILAVMKTALQWGLVKSSKTHCRFEMTGSELFG